MATGEKPTMSPWYHCHGCHCIITVTADSPALVGLSVETHRRTLSAYFRGWERMLPTTPPIPDCMRFLGLLEQSATNWVASNNRSVLSHSFLEARSPKSRCHQICAPSDTCQGESFLPPGFWGWLSVLLFSISLACSSALQCPTRSVSLLLFF